MSEESIKINGVVQVVVYLILGAVYLAVLYFIVQSSIDTLMHNDIFLHLSNMFKSGLADQGKNATFILTASLVFLSIVSGMLIYDATRKFSIISLFLLAIITVVDLVPLSILAEGKYL